MKFLSGEIFDCNSELSAAEGLVFFRLFLRKRRVLAPIPKSTEWDRENQGRTRRRRACQGFPGTPEVLKDLAPPPPG